MNVLIAVVCLSLITLVNAAHDINYDTILKILKGKPRRIDNSIIDEPYRQVEKNAIASKFSKLLFENPKAWPDDQFEFLNVQDTRHNTNNRYSRKGLKEKHLMKNLLNGNININKYRGSEEYGYDKTEETKEDTGDLMKNILNVIQNINQGRVNKNGQRPPLVIFLLGEEARQDKVSQYLYGTRRSSGKDNDILLSSTESDTDSADSYEKNPGNPFTIHKNKYKQNWPYNHYMDGDHMNINPFGPQFSSSGPTGPELFFGRKWWYFNQDDYKPIG